MILFWILDHSSIDLLESILILADDKNKVLGSYFDFFGEVFTKHVVNLNNESQCDKGFDNHRWSWGLTHSNYKDDLSEEGRDDLEGTEDDIDYSASLAALGSLHIF